MNPTQPAGRMNSGVAVLLALIAVAFLLFYSWATPHWWGVTHSSITNWGGYSPFGIFYGMLGIGALIQLALAVWVGIDAQRQGTNGFLWGVLVFFTPVIGLIVYLLLAPAVARRNGGPLASALTAPAGPPGTAAATQQPASETCPACRAEVEPEFKVCPVCGTSLRCSSCEKPIRGGWKVCPYCTTPLATSSGS